MAVLRQYLRVVVPVAMVLAGGGSLVCTNTVRTKVESSAADALLSPEQEAQIGAEIERQLATQVKWVSDPRVVDYVNELTGRIFAAAKSESPRLAVQVHVIDDAHTVNAFATAGSRLYVYSGLVLAATNEAELAGVLGHETGHIVARHPARQMVNQFGLSTLGDILLGRNPAELGELAASVVSKGYLLANSRADETEADEFGARFASRASYDPRALGQFLARITRNSPPEPWFVAFLSDHPATSSRIAHLEAYIAQHDLGGRKSDDGKLAAAQQALRSNAVGGGPPGP